MPSLQFKGKIAVECYHHTIPHHTLEFDRSLSVLDDHGKSGLDGNLIIEGDNLLALKALLPTHAGRIKCIYIDPPYNTGNEKWVFNDNLTQPQFKEWIGNIVGKEAEDATRHDKWCCMMYPRLQLLKELLRDDGAIFISIDDNEIHHLRMLMDEIFGENFVAQVSVLCNPKGRVMAQGFAQTHEYLLVYTKIPEGSDFSRTKTDKEIEEEYNLTDEKGRFRMLELRNTHRQFGKHNRKKLHYPLFVNQKTGSVSTVSQKGLFQILPNWDDGFEGCWTWEEEKAHKEAQLLVGKMSGGKWRIFRKSYASGARKKPTTTWLDKEVQTEKGQSLLDEIMGRRVFYAPKPIGLIKKILLSSTEDEDIILDSFAGSGTTGHAVLDLNKDDGGSRKFILIQMPYDTKENEKEKFNICQEITAERVRRVIEGYSYKTQNGKKEKIDGLGGSFVYGRLGPPLLREFRNFGEKLPSYENLAKYIYYTETSRDFDAKMADSKTGKIGESSGTSYYLLFSSNQSEDKALNQKWLESIEKSEKNRNLVIYCEKLWMHRDDLANYEIKTGRKVRPMIIPFQLK